LRWVVLAVAAVISELAVWSALRVALAPGDVAPPAETYTVTGPAAATAAVWLTVVVGALVLPVCAVIALAARRWSATSRRHESAPAPIAAADPHDTWDALSRGADPTVTNDG
jgi:ABC-type sulfate transport system permease subunit